jgi:hypothetical protein
MTIFCLVSSTTELSHYFGSDLYVLEGADCLAAGDGSDDDEGLFAGCDGFGQWCVGRLVREILLAGEEAQEWTALQRDLVADGAAQHGIAGLEGVEDGALGDWAVYLYFYFVAHVRQGSQMVREYDPDDIHSDHFRHRSRVSLVDTFPQRLKPLLICGSYGTAEAVPFPLPLSELRSLDSRGRLSLREPLSELRSLDSRGRLSLREFFRILRRRALRRD